MSTKSDILARALGWVSLALGAAQLTAPRTVSRLSGVDDSRLAPTAVRIMGIRELMHAAVLLGSRRPAPWTWSRVAGDAMELALLGRAAAARTGRRRRRAVAATAAVSGITALDLAAALYASGPRGRRPMRLRASITVNRPREEVYAFWRDLENLPAFMLHLESVRAMGERRSRWRARSPLTDVEWEAEILDERPGELIAWESARGSMVTTSGSVRFADGPAGLGTVVHVTLDYRVPGGTVGTAVARMFGEHPEQQVRDDLRRFKQIMETGEVLVSEGSPEGVRALRQLRQRPAQPVGSPS
ncbi:cyclase [Nonomuraea phyllanthi]|uniref:Cyclase n=1 Tax=Nonomuraea phyllanthi TaxID=2219224 RepID=A0A5C4WPU1_9ACTN|nr:SRPBCC family protein [Nonomuraea phyllanthi]KAB8195465.1 cyclase [Nonomuraea phyllanthi]QFY10401.1 cyclase [Nonomuraea phyllanthi]